MKTTTYDEAEWQLVERKLLRHLRDFVLAAQAAGFKNGYRVAALTSQIDDALSAAQPNGGDANPDDDICAVCGRKLANCACHFRESPPPPDSTSGAGVWQTMDSAPKDGTRVLLSDGGKFDEAYVGWWTTDAYAENGGKGGPVGWLSNIPGDHVVFDHPQYWQPLPLPPQERTDG